MYFFLNCCDSIEGVVFETVVFLCRLLSPNNKTSKLLFILFSFTAETLVQLP